MSETFETGDAIWSWMDVRSHRVLDTGFQLLTTCGKRITKIGARPEGETASGSRLWKRAEAVDCPECLEATE